MATVWYSSSVQYNWNDCCSSAFAGHALHALLCHSNSSTPLQMNLSKKSDEQLMSRGQSCEISWIFQTKKLGKCRKFKYFLRWGVKVCFNILSVPKIWHFETLTEASSPSVMASNSLVNRSSVQSLYFETYWWSSYTKSQVCQHLFFWRHGPSGKSDITTFSSRVATALKWSTVRGFILTQADKFTLRKYLSSLKLVLASDTGSLYFLAVCLLFWTHLPSLIHRGFQCVYL